MVKKSDKADNVRQLTIIRMEYPLQFQYVIIDLTATTKISLTTFTRFFVIIFGQIHQDSLSLWDIQQFFGLKIFSYLDVFQHLRLI